MGNIEIESFKTKVGQIYLAAFENKLLYVGLPNGEGEMKLWLKRKLPNQNLNLCATMEVLRKAKQQILEYLEGERKNFDIEFSLIGTSFQNKVWNKLTTIPYGATISYKIIGQTIGYQSGFQAIGQAVGNNPLALIIPCHRVIGNNGCLTGYAGGLELKDFLLKHERENC